MQTSSRYGLAAALAAIALSACTGSTGPKGSAGADGINGTNGTNGANGTNGTSCSVTKTGSTATVTCGTDSVQIADGTAGGSCAMVTNADGTKTITCGTQVVTISPSTVNFAAMTTQQKADSNLNLILTGFSVDAAGAGTVTFKVNDRYGNGVSKLWRNDATTTTLNTSLRFGLLQLVPGVNGSANDTWVSYNAAPPTGTAPNLVYATGSAESAGTSATSKPVIDNGDGTYAYTYFRNVGQSPVVTYDATKLHRVVIILTASGNPIAPLNVVRDFQPSLGITDLSKDGSADVFDPASCLECHGQFRATAVVPPAAAPAIAAAFHGGGRYDPRACVACHNDQRRFATYATADAAGVTISSAAIPNVASPTWLGNLALIQGEAYFNMPQFIHKIHMGEDLGLKGGPYAFVDPRDVTYPQAVNNCVKCHRTVALKDNWMNKPSVRACTACHDTKWFGATAARPAFMTQHSGGAKTDATCSGCHAAADIQGYHLTVAPPAADNCFLLNNATGCNNNTNAASLAAAGAVPTGATAIAYDVSSVSTWSDTSVTPNVNRPQIVFKLKKTVGTTTSDVDFGTHAAGTNEELIPGFVGGPSVYFAWSETQDGIATPADWNVTANNWLKSCWRSGTNCNLTRNATTGYYTLQSKNAVVPAGAAMLTGGVGYSYGLQATQPLTQIDLPAYPAVDINVTAGTVNFGTSTAQDCTVTTCVVKTGGLIVPAANVWKTATGFTARRTIVATAKCIACHAALGVAPTFHAGQRNDAPTCAFCHTPNRTSNGWSANTKDFVHAIHGAGKRSVPFTWHGTSATDNYSFVTYPGELNLCTQCHLAGTFDFSAAAYTSATASVVPNLLPSTVGVGTYTVPASPAYDTNSPYVVVGTAYGAGYATSGSATSGTQAGVACTVAAPCTCTTASPCDAADTTLIKSPIVSACSACHDKPAAIDHMQTMGGAFYEPRSTKLKTPEQCLICHGPGTAGDISMAHMGI